MRGISTGGLSFAELRERNKYYVDKSLLIKDILDTDDCGAYLFTRPRRFGKTDIVLRPKDETQSPMVFELKTSKKAENLTADAEDAIRQIRDMQYYRGMPGDVRIYGISFFSSTLKVLTETVRDDRSGSVSVTSCNGTVA